MGNKWKKLAEKRKLTTEFISLEDKRLVAGVCAHTNPNNEITNNNNNNKFNLIRNAKSKCENSRREQIVKKKYEKNLIREQ